MSLILDALRKADAERERGALPSLHSQPVTRSSETPEAPKGRPTLLWVAIGISVGLLGAAATWVMVGRLTPPSIAPVNAGPAAAPVPSPSVAIAPVPGPATTPAAMDAPQNVAQPAPWPTVDERKAPRPEAKGVAPVPVLGNVAPAPASVVSREQLPPDIRAQLPQFVIGGSIYSNVPAGRSLIVNGQLYRERDRLTQDLSLEEIRLKAAIFSYRGHRFEVQF